MKDKIGRMVLQMSRIVRGFLLLMVLCVAGLVIAPAENAEASSAKSEITGFKEEISTNPKTGAEIYRLEYGITTPEIQFSRKYTRKNPNQLQLVFKKTKLGKLEQEYQMDGRYASAVSFDDSKDGKVTVTVKFAGNVKKQGYKIYYAKADKRAGKPDRLVMEIQRRGSYGYNVDLKGLEGRTIVIDPGHGGVDGGATGPSGIREKAVTLYVSQALDDILEANGARVVMTRWDDRDVYGPQATDHQELDARVDVARRTRGADVFVSIHCDAFSSPEASGTSTFIYGRSPEDYKLGQALQAGMIRRGGRKDRGVRKANFYVVKHSPVPAALVELAFITNYKEEMLLCSDGFQQDMAVGIAEGLAEFLRDYSGNGSIRDGSRLSPRQRRGYRNKERKASLRTSKEERRRK